MASKAVSDAHERASGQPGPYIPPGARPAGQHGKYVSSSVAGAAKILVVGPLGVGKTTLIGTVSEIRPLSTEAMMTQAGARYDTLVDSGKTTTTVALDFGRITIDGALVLYLFGTPGQQRFLPAWRDLARGALGALALVDTRDLAASFDALGNLEELGLPFAVAVNVFPGSPHHSADELRSALDLLPGTPLVECDARDLRSSVRALISLLGHLIDTAHPAVGTGPGAVPPAGRPGAAGGASLTEWA
ncbi:GTP-binding protein [Streptomyces clavuligerus]|uniref:Putative ATP/GTP-binding protein n=1 Tax=Streptomyces clavuligerus TaxID=1901 RepID=E2Q6C4_STRCL|nr:ATP/GTP-binding protein [Streptomyces clavuligerus]AXU14500.1 ATP/GTP-binding protein [Streptomyces clavuligerus]EFG07248.1 putative ATP/GTP-binding protein [Streptomyces clavuligerus]MBY6304512.1 ATP/GTP-binding protein [Streptomyces clavuligerus]QCS07274.1 ATP/GTP-binding protein [Streptomyces clavuligerus]QPJ93376.1 ATP/GTP-binding protein [Streptomyces clavuligerus]